MMTQYKPMKPETADLDQIRLPAFASTKLDGIRGRVYDDVLWSNTNKRIPNPHISALFGKKALNGYDGEIIVGDPTAPGVCGLTAGTCGRRSDLVVPDVRFYVFDNFLAKGGYRQRLATLKSMPRVEILQQTLIESRTELEAYVEVSLDSGYEGVILRALDAPYKQGRSTISEGWMLRIKPFIDGEAEILGVVEQMRNDNPAMTNGVGRTQRSTAKAGKVGKGTAGALECRELGTGVLFTMPCGDEKMRADFWAQREAIAEAADRGRPLLVKFKHCPYGRKNAPRFPGFKHLLKKATPKGKREPIGLRPRWDVEGVK